MLLALARAVFLGSESLGTHGHILLSQFWDFSFRLLLWLAGSRWRNSTPPPHGCDLNDLVCPFCNPSARTTQKTQLLYCWGGVFTALLHKNCHGADHIENTALLFLRTFVSAGTFLPSFCLEKGCITPLFCCCVRVCCERYIATAAVYRVAV
jgi:hypothetical protein